MGIVACAGSSQERVIGELPSAGSTVRFAVPTLPQCVDPAIYLHNARNLVGARIGARAVDVRHRPYGMVPLRESEPGTAEAELIFRDHLFTGERPLTVGCGSAMLAEALLIDMGQFFVGGILLLGGILVGALSLSYRRTRALRWLALFLVSMGVIAVDQSGAWPRLVFTDVRPLDYARNVCSFTVIIAAARFVLDAVGDVRGRVLHRASVAMTAALVACVGIDLAGGAPLLRTVHFAFAASLALLPVWLIPIVRKARGGDGAAVRLVWGAAVLLLFAIPDLLWGLGLPHLPLNTSPLGFLTLAMTMGAVVEMRMREQEAQLAASAAQL